MSSYFSTHQKASLLVLSVLESRAMYGYELIEALRLYPKNLFVMQEGQVYPLLHHLEKEGYLKSYRQEKEGKNRKYYQLTVSGLLHLEKEKDAYFQSLRSFHQAMRYQDDE